WRQDEKQHLRSRSTVQRAGFDSTSSNSTNCGCSSRLASRKTTDTGKYCSQNRNTLTRSTGGRQGTCSGGRTPSPIRPPTFCPRSRQLRTLAPPSKTRSTWKRYWRPSREVPVPVVSTCPSRPELKDEKTSHDPLLHPLHRTVDRP